jgi:hypothetical protein
MSFQATASRDIPDEGSPNAETGTHALDPLRPLLAGAHARGMADALEMAGIAFLMVDAQGMVLHAGPAARALMGADLRIEFDHLVAASGEATCAIQSMVMAGLSQGEAPQPLRLARGEGAPLILTVRRVPGAAGNVYQMLKLLILIEQAVYSGIRN